jgi:8-oxo-dGTP pyrophosphatase MutT (NUDIX family)
MSDDHANTLPRGFAENARALARGELVVTEPRHAATVVLLRDGADGIEAYLLRRTRTMAFAAGFFVFPGGSVDPRDRDLPGTAWVGPPAQDWTGPLAADEGLARALVCAAVRETFEESGVLLAGDDDGVVSDTSGEDWESDRLALLDGSLSFAELLKRRGLKLRADQMRAWAHWITPEVEPKRFDTRFFLAAMPTEQRTRDVGGEADRVTWLRPAVALDRQRSGDLAMLPPTLFTLGELASFDTVAAALAAGTERDVQTVLPKVVVGDADDIRLLLPHDADYPADGDA